MCVLLVQKIPKKNNIKREEILALVALKFQFKLLLFHIIVTGDSSIIVNERGSKKVTLREIVFTPHPQIFLNCKKNLPKKKVKICT